MKVEGYLYRVPVGRLKESEHFKSMLESAHMGGDGEGRSDEHPITLEGISNFEMESFMDVIQAKLDFCCDSLVLEADPSFSGFSLTKTSSAGNKNPLRSTLRPVGGSTTFVTV